MAFPFEVLSAPMQMKALTMLGDLAALAEYEKCEKKDLHCFQQALAEARFAAANSLFNAAIKPNLGSRLPAPAASLEPKEQLETQGKDRSRFVSRHKKVFSRQSTPVFNSAPPVCRAQSDHALPSIGEDGDELPRAFSVSNMCPPDFDENSCLDLSESSSDDESAASVLVASVHDNAEQTDWADAAPAAFSRSLNELPSPSALLAAHDTSRHSERISSASESDSGPRGGELRAPCRSVSFTPNQNPFRATPFPCGTHTNTRESQTPQVVDIANGDDEQNIDDRSSMSSGADGAVLGVDDGHDDHAEHGDDSSTSRLNRSRAFRSSGSVLDHEDAVMLGQFAMPPAAPRSQSAFVRSSMNARTRSVDGTTS